MTAQEAKALAIASLTNRTPIRMMRHHNHLNSEDFVTDDESELLILNLAHARGDRGFNEDEVTEILKEAAIIRLENSILDLALKGLLYVDVDLNSDGRDKVVWKRAPELLAEQLRETHAVVADPQPGA